MKDQKRRVSRVSASNAAAAKVSSVSRVFWFSLVVPVVLVILVVLASISKLTLPVFAQENVNVSLTVNPKVSDFQFALSSTDGATNVAENTTLSYQILYGANASAEFDTTMTLEADFSDDLAPGGSHVVDYVLGSAGTAYGGALPVVDLINRKITWTISNLPSGTTNQTVAFQLKTNSNYTGGSVVNFITRAKMSNQYATMPDQTITQYYQYSLATTPTPTPTAASSPTATSGVEAPVASPAPTTAASSPLQTSPRITDIDFSNISPTSAVIAITTFPATRQTVFYGTSPTLLSQKAESTDYSLISRVSLTGLRSNTVYYFRVESTDRNGNIVRSEIFTFQSASISDSLVIVEGAYSIESMGRTLYSKIVDKNSTPGFVLITENTDFTLNYTSNNPVMYKSFEVIVKNKSGSEKSVSNLLQIDANLYSAFLQTLNPGQYEIFLKARDLNGNLTELKIAELKVVAKLRVVDGDNNPIGDARVFLYYYDTKSGKYLPITKEIFRNAENPLFTDSNGKLNLVLPTGRFRVEVSAFFYEKETKDFTLGSGLSEEFPVITLNKNIFNFLSLGENLKDWLSDSFTKLTEMIVFLASSSKVFNASAVIVTGAFSFLSFIFFFLKTHLTPKNLPIFFMFGIHMVLNKHKEKYIFGKIVSVDDLPLSHVRIELLNRATGEVITHTTSNKLGRFHFHEIGERNNLILRIGKDGYKETEYDLSKQYDELNISLLKANGKSKSASIAVRLAEHIGASLFETTLAASIIIELFYLFSFGLVKTLPFLILSMLNIILWMFFLKESRS